MSDQANTQTAALIALDWGTSSLRAWLLDAHGQVLDQRAERQGIMQIADGDFARVYHDLVAEWVQTHGPLPALACGMIGSRNGWVEAPYVDTPADPSTLANQLTRIDTGAGPLHIVPGVMQAERGTQLPDVMRGEETQVLGALAGHPALGDDALLVLPGTHCKWVVIQQGRVTGFTTYMTGELFAVLREHSILGRPAREAGDAATPSESDTQARAFALGVDTAREAGATGIAAVLFSTRSRMLVGELQASDTLSYLSGLLIGDELRSVFSCLQDTPSLCLIGDANLCDRYTRALARFDRHDAILIEDAARHGLWQIAQAAHLV